MATGLCPVGLVSAGGDSGVKVTWYLLYLVGLEVYRQALGFAGFSRYGPGRNGCEVITLRRRVYVQSPG